MVKRTSLFVLLCMLGALALQAASPWAEDRDSASVRNGEMPLNRRPNKDEALSRADKNKALYRMEHLEKVTLLPLVLKGETLKISIYPPDEVDGAARSRVAQDRVRRAYNDWFANAASIIRKQNRAEEFKDILPILQWGVSIDFVSFGAEDEEQQENVWINMEKTLKDVVRMCKCNCTGCQLLGDQYDPMRITVVENGAYSTLLHEVGHTLGLAGAYEGEYELTASPMYGSSKRVAQTVMNEKEEAILGEDDADGLINMIDAWNIYFLRQKYPQDWCTYVPERVRKGWNSLHNSTERYVMGTSVEHLPELPPAQRCDQ